MITKDKRLLGTLAGAMALAAAAGFGVARCTADPVAAPVQDGGGETESETEPDSLAITPAAIEAAEIGVETIGAGGLGSEIIAQATVTAAPGGEAGGRPGHPRLQTARRSGARRRTAGDRAKPRRGADRRRTHGGGGAGGARAEDSPP
jgi:hypothetical protein